MFFHGKRNQKPFVFEALTERKSLVIAHTESAMTSEAYSMSPGGAGSQSHNNKSSLLLSFKKEESSFLKKRSKRLLFSCADFTVRLRSEACFRVVRLIGGGEQLHSLLLRVLRKEGLASFLAEF